MGEVTIQLGDARRLDLPDNSIDAIVCDPPYELAFMGKRWDDTGVAYDPNTWVEAFRVLKPGGHLLAFGGTRTSHRMVSAIEDAYFEIRDSIIWLYGSGFPKSLDVSKAIDKAAGAEREVTGTQKLTGTARQSTSHGGHGAASSGEARDYVPTVKLLTAPATDDARQWTGWGTALKPAHEPIAVARKPFRGTVASNVLEHGTGALNVDGCRASTGDTLVRPDIERRDNAVFGLGLGSGTQVEPPGRWPSNVVLSHLSDADGGDACADGCVDGCPVAELDGQSGVLPGNRGISGTHGGGRSGGVMGARVQRDYDFAGYSDTGGASRFFPTFRYQAKAPTRERPKVDGVQHPTVKPLALMRWLVRLVTPPGGTVLDPFAGSGTTVEAAILEGFDVIAVESHEPYLALIQARVDRAA